MNDRAAPAKSGPGNQHPPETITADAEWEPLRVLAGQAWELRETPYFDDAIRAIGEWWDRRFVTAFERRQEHQARLIQLLRETDPAKLPARQVAA